ncbi:MAG: DUF4926 domain-containing protein [Acidobacteriota bacterium]|nr:DUF4926 domain-containing protein [Acidobacteriota bacterium]
MLETKKAHLLDIVELTEDLPEYGVKRGERGAVVEVFDSPEEAYILEFVDKSGTSSRMAYWVKPRQITLVKIVNGVNYERKESGEQRVTAEPKGRYIVASLFAIIFIASTILLAIVSGAFRAASDTSTWIAVFTTIVSAIGTISTTTLAWRKDGRAAREEELKTTQLEREQKRTAPKISQR